jgi:putative transposase
MLALTKSMSEQRRGSHTVTRLTVDVVWVTKYRYHVLKGDIQKRCRELIIQICDAEDVKILKGVVSKDHVHMHLEYPPSKSVERSGQTIERTDIKTSATGESRATEAILGKTLLGNRLWSMEHGKYNGEPDV